MAYPKRSVRFLDSEIPPGVKWLLIVTVGAFLVYYFADLFDVGEGFFDWLVLSPSRIIGSLAVWQLVTWMFLHNTADVFHVLFNMLTLYWFGPDIERSWGTRRFVQYYFICGIGAGLVVCLVDLLFGQGTRTIGASGAICGVMLAYAMLLPDREILFMLIFPLKVKYVVAILAGINFLFSLQGRSGVSYVAHLGGFLVGWLYFQTRYRRGGFDPVAALEARYKDWKLQRARRKFQVYMNKVDRDRRS